MAPRYIRLTIALLVASLASFLGWAALAQLDEVASAPGQIVPSGAVQVVQHQEGGTIARIAVAEGERVKQGQLLVALERVDTESELKVAQARRWSLAARIARLKAQAEERWDAPDLQALPEELAQMAREQRQILASHRLAIENQEAVIRAQIAQLEADSARIQGQISTAEREVRVLREVAGIRADLEKEKLVTRVAMLETQRTLILQEGEVKRLQAQRVALEANGREARARMSTISSERRQVSLDEMGAASAELAQVLELLVKLRKRLDRTDVFAPASGYVQDLKYRTVGGVIPPGAVVLSVVPVEGILQAEVRIATTDVGHVRLGQLVRVKVLTYDFLRYGTIEGHLIGVSASSFVDEKDNPYFKGIVRLTRNHLGVRAEDYPVLPGMTVVCDIVTDRKTVLEYLVRPVAVAFRQGLRER